MVVAVVIRQGRIRFSPASTTEVRIDFHGFGFIVFKGLGQISGHNHPIIRSNAEQGNKPDPNSHTQINGVHLKQLSQIFPRES